MTILVTYNIKGRVEKTAAGDSLACRNRCALAYEALGTRFKNTSKANKQPERKTIHGHRDRTQIPGQR